MGADKNIEIEKIEQIFNNRKVPLNLQRPLIEKKENIQRIKTITRDNKKMSIDFFYKAVSRIK